MIKFATGKIDTYLDASRKWLAYAFGGSWCQMFETLVDTGEDLIRNLSVVVAFVR